MAPVFGDSKDRCCLKRSRPQGSIRGKMKDINKLEEVTKYLSERMFDENQMYQELKEYALQRGFSQMEHVIDYVCEKHQGQFRKGKEKIPYVYHPLSVAYHAIVLGLEEEDLLSAALLHDVCEDCHIPVEELPVNATTKTAVSLLTKDKTAIKEEPDGMDKYYEKIAQNRIAHFIKCLDRCHNVSHMAAAFSREKMASYVWETKKYYYPMLDEALKQFPQQKNQIVAIRYHLMSVTETICQMIKKERNQKG